MNVEYKINDTEDLDDYLDNNDFELEGNYEIILRKNT